MNEVDCPMELASKRVLIVDDQPTNIELLETLLEEHGFEQLEGVSDPRQVLNHCRRQRPDLILLDIRMPHLDGFQVLEQLESHFAEQMPPVIVLTAQIDDQTRLRALSMGVRDFLGKPLRHDEVIQRLNNVLAVQHRYQVRDRQADELELMVAERTRQLEYQSRTDPITGLPNRRALLQHLDALARAGRSIGLLFIALDSLDDIVRLHGYGVTETLLWGLGDSLEEQLDASHYLGLWAGSELLIVWADATDLASLERLALVVHEHIQTNHHVGDLLLPLKARIGVHFAQGGEPERLVQMAALALPLPQRDNRHIQSYTRGLEAAQQKHLSLQQALHGAVLRGEFSLTYQPKVSLVDGRVQGVEALLRWYHPNLGWVPPEEFVPLAEASGDILAIGAWALEAAIRQAAQWYAEGRIADEFDVAINVAARQLSQKNFAERLLSLLVDHRLPCQHLSLEVTESDLMVDVETARTQLTLLSRAGIRIAIDDFGTGYSSLAYLKALPVSVLKIDRAFVDGLADNPEDQRLVRMIIALAHGCGCLAVAEGIESRDQAKLLKGLGCDVGQGYLYSAPLTADELVALCREAEPGLANLRACLDP
ncbi:diguanylate cyclase (GGDEF) domain-containing protein [Modicisalibacter ilicicola DSM 19980]|uniref:Diguanylate cyclase (GGDEF) domain-containing protein n=1 Tax=Modicisalibacter ilicicola DSM 19980 TaxID=1121942 RepID=A0A1M4WEI7_9GAMM|nr:EAL domain-containing protein [Halomonas ilicicola]SHE79624.1 diguanylate cyclase (GGDEF) domain-containing protein [Halomonas ilicicola DSM 19980]